MMAYLVGCVSVFSWLTLLGMLLYAAGCELDHKSIAWNIVSLVLILVVILDSSILATIRSKYKLVELVKPAETQDKRGDGNN